MSKKEICEIYDQSLRILNANYVPGGSQAEYFIWITICEVATDFIGVESGFKFDNPKRMPDEQVEKTLSQDCSEVEVQNGVAVKCVPNVFSEGVIKWIIENWESLSMSSKDFLIERSKQEGREQEPLRQALKTILEENK